MKKLLILIFFISVSSFAQKVPSRIEFADMKLHLSDRLRDEIQKDVDMLTVSPKYFQIKVDRAKIYFPIIERVFKEEGVPDDFKYLVLQESALIPDAVSVSDAVGYWQFKDFTAMEMGLRVDRQVDERMHIVSSTYGAAGYMKKNNKYFDNWLYALQAYQMGAGGALKVVDKKYYGAKTMHLDHKTYWYVKKYLAHKIAFESALEGNSDMILNVYTKGSNKTLKEIAEETSVDYDQLIAYNVWLKSKRIPDDKNYSVILPLSYSEAGPIKVEIEKAEPSIIPQKVIIAKQNQYPVFDTRTKLFTREEIRTINGIPGIVAQNESTLIDLAAKADMSLGRFMKFNDLDVKDRPISGQVYYLKRKKAKAPTYYHIVNYGESLWEISQQYGVRLQKLILKNRLRSEEDIKPGLVLWLRHVRPESVPAEYKKVAEPKPEAPKKEMVIAENAVDKSKVKSPQAKDEPAKETKPATEKYEVEDNEAEDQLVEKRMDMPEDEAEVSISEEEKPAEEDDAIEVADVIEVKYSEEATRVVDDPVSEDEKEIDSLSDSQNLVQHKVQPGETFYAISKKYEVNVVDILAWNNLNINDKLAVGQEIKILQEKDTKDQTELVDLRIEAAQNQYHEVKQGETLYQIARKYQVTIQEILEWNDKNDSSISVGDRLIVKK